MCDENTSFSNKRVEKDEQNFNDGLNTNQNHQNTGGWLYLMAPAANDEDVGYCAREKQEEITHIKQGIKG